MRLHKLVSVSLVLAVCGSVGWQVGANDSAADWGASRGSAPFQFAFIGDMPYGAALEGQFVNLVREVNRDPGIDFVMHAGDIKAGNERCDDALILHRFEMYEEFRRPFVFTPGDNEWTDCHRVNNGSYHPLERLAFLRATFFPRPGVTTGRHVRRVHSQAEEGVYTEFVENVLFRKHSVLFAALHVVGSNNNLDPWSGIDPNDSFATPRADRLAEFQRREEATLAWLDRVFEEAQGARGVFLMIQANPNFSLASTDQQRQGFNQFLARLDTLAREYGRPVLLAHGDNHVFFMDQPLTNPLFSRMQTFGSGLVHWVKVHVDPRSSGVFSIEQKVVRANLN